MTERRILVETTLVDELNETNDCVDSVLVNILLTLEGVQGGLNQSIKEHLTLAENGIQILGTHGERRRRTYRLQTFINLQTSQIGIQDDGYTKITSMLLVGVQTFQRDLHVVIYRIRSNTLGFFILATL